MSEQVRRKFLWVTNMPGLWQTLDEDTRKGLQERVRQLAERHGWLFSEKDPWDHQERSAYQFEVYAPDPIPGSPWLPLATWGWCRNTETPDGLVTDFLSRAGVYYPAASEEPFKATWG